MWAVTNVRLNSYITDLGFTKGVPKPLASFPCYLHVSIGKAVFRILKETDELIPPPHADETQPDADATQPDYDATQPVM